jgi:hypothetical protein
LLSPHKNKKKNKRWKEESTIGSSGICKLRRSSSYTFFFALPKKEENLLLSILTVETKPNSQPQKKGQKWEKNSRREREREFCKYIPPWKYGRPQDKGGNERAGGMMANNCLKLLQNTTFRNNSCCKHNHNSTRHKQHKKKWKDKNPKEKKRQKRGSKLNYLNLIQFQIL